MRSFLLVSVWFELIWLLAVLGQEQWQWLTTLLVVVTLLFSAWRLSVAVGRICAVAVTGIAIDVANMHLGLFFFINPHLPVWLIALWFIFVWFAAFAIPALSHLPSWLVIIATGLGGALSYWAGYRFGAVGFGLPVFYTVLALFLEWLGVSLLLIKVFSNENVNRHTFPEHTAVDRRNSQRGRG
ncbi:DUF2878 domain-containing protein [Vibrio ostreae]|uniref:DUF2878 domain-containing protein n=2 Tax=Vibrionaceae TaxID=641 RepID=A0A975UDW9_9VIBR|nr:DUF2878 domain-containing protein [Vibrio ostreae]WGY48767.1 DUF2878 domain-containing protein [Vibrio sp. ABG19]